MEIRQRRVAFAFMESLIGAMRNKFNIFIGGMLWKSQEQE